MILANQPSIISTVTNDVAYRNCTVAATSIVSIIKLWEKSFGCCRFLIIAYSVYAAATIFILQWVNEQNRSFHDYLQVCHDFLAEVSKTCPAIKAPADIIQSYLERNDATVPPEDLNNAFGFCNTKYPAKTTYKIPNMLHSCSSVHSWFACDNSGPSAYGGLSVLSRNREPPQSYNLEKDTSLQHDSLELPMVTAESYSPRLSDFWQLESSYYTEGY